MQHTPVNCLVTGGLGFIGVNFVRMFLNKHPDSTIINLDAMTYAANRGALDDYHGSERYFFYHGDICQFDLVNTLFSKHRIDTVVHFAAESHVDRSIRDPMQFIKTNVLGTSVLLEAARQYWTSAHWRQQTCRFHQVSTDEVYGSLKLGDPPFLETTPYAPNSPYSASKASADHCAMAYYRTYGLPVTISNCSNNFGPYQHPEKFIPTVVRACYHAQPVPLYGTGDNRRDWIYVDDHNQQLDAIIRLGTPGQRYNIGTDNEWSNIALAKAICEIMDILRPQAKPHSGLIKHITDRQGHDFRYAIDTVHTESFLTIKHSIDFNTRLSETIRWLLATYTAEKHSSVQPTI